MSGPVINDGEGAGGRIHSTSTPRRNANTTAQIRAQSLISWELENFILFHHK